VKTAARIVEYRARRSAFWNRWPAVRIDATTALGRRMFMAWTSGAKQLVPEFGR